MRAKRQELGITEQRAEEIINEVQAPYPKRLKNIELFKEAFTEAVEQNYPLSERLLNELKDLEDVLGLEDREIAQIQKQILAKKQAEYQLQQQEQEEYKNKLQQYEQELLKAVKQEYPLGKQARDLINSSQQSLGLRDEDIALIEQPILAQEETKYQKKLKEEEAKRQRKQEAERYKQLELQEQREIEKLRQQELEYQQKLQQYEEHIFNAKWEGEIPSHIRQELRQLQQNLGLIDSDVSLIEEKLASRRSSTSRIPSSSPTVVKSSKRVRLIAGIVAILMSVGGIGVYSLSIAKNELAVLLESLESQYQQGNYEECYQLAIDNLNRNHSVINKWIGDCGLEAAKIKAKANSFSGAINIAQKIPNTVPNYQEIKDSINRWSGRILDYATKLYKEEGKLEEAVKTTEIIPDNTSVKVTVPKVIVQWQKDYTKHQAIIERAQELLNQEQWNAAIDEVEKIPSDFGFWIQKAEPIFNKANQQRLKEQKARKDQSILDEAQKLANSGDYEQAIAKAQTISSNSDLYPQAQTSMKLWQQEIDQRRLESRTTGVNYSRLNDLLAAKKWKEADRETTERMLQAAGREQKRWLREEDLNKFSCEDLRIIDRLWLDYSPRDGFSVQKEIWQNNGSPTIDSPWEIWRQFFDANEGNLPTWDSANPIMQGGTYYGSDHVYYYRHFFGLFFSRAANCNL